MKPSDPTPAPALDDPAVAAEWKRLEAERLAGERAEAREDAADAADHPGERDAGRRWLLPAFAAALAAGVALAILLNRPVSGPTSESERAVDVRRAVDIWAEANRIDDASLASAGVRRVASTAAVPPERLVVRVNVRDQQGRDRLESLLAASGLRIESDRERGPAEAASAGLDSLVVSGPPADVDALIDRLIASPTMLDVQSPALLAARATGSEQAAATAAAPVSEVRSSTDGGAGSPPRVRLVVEVSDGPVAGPPPPAGAVPGDGR